MDDKILGWDIIGDLHGCFVELIQLLEKLGYIYDGLSFKPPRNRIAVFVGDLTSRGPNSLAVIFLVRDMIRKNHALSVQGNHCCKIMRWAMGRDVILTHGDDGTAREIENSNTITKEEIVEFFSAMPYFLVLDEGKLVVTHAAWRDSFIDRDPFAKKVRSYCLFGPTVPGELDVHGLPTRLDWTSGRRPSKTDPIVVYGHQPYREVRIENKTYGIDTGSCFGGHLTCLRYPEMTVVQVKSLITYENFDARWASPVVSRIKCEFS